MGAHAHPYWRCCSLVSACFKTRRIECFACAFTIKLARRVGTSHRHWRKSLHWCDSFYGPRADRAPSKPKMSSTRKMTIKM